MTRRKNLESLIKIIFYIVLELLLFYALLQNKLEEYIHPRYRIGILISMIILFLFLLIEIPHVVKARHNENLMSYFVYFIPLFLVLLFPAGILLKGNVQISEPVLTGATDTPTTNWSFSSADDGEGTITENVDPEQGGANQSTGQQSESDSLTATSNNLGTGNMSSGVDECRRRLEAEGTMEISDDIFADWYEDIYANLNLYEGKRVTYLAQVFFVDELNENQFIAGRYFMVCCIADLTGCGIISESEEINKFHNEQWVRVTGTIGSCDYNGGKVPKLIDVVLEETTAPGEEYIYYNYY